MAADDAGNAIAAWAQAGRFQAVRYSIEEGTWGPLTDLGGATGGLSQAIPAITVDTRGNATIIWASGTAIRAVRCRLSDGLWEPVVDLVPTGALPSPDVGATTTGDVMAVWGDFDRIWTSRYSAALGTWSAPRDLSDGLASPRIAVDAAGNATVITFSGFWGTGVIRAMRYSADSGTWGMLTQLMQVSQLATIPAVGVDAAGNVVVTWSSLSGSSLSLHAIRFIAATGEWGTATTLGPASVMSHEGPALSVAPAGEAIVLWAAPDGRVVSSRYDVTTGSWAAAMPVSDPDVSPEVGAVGIDASGRAMAVWRQGDHRVYAARNGGIGDTWTPPEPISASGLQSVYPPQLAIGSPRRATVVWDAGQSTYWAIQGTHWVATPSAPAILGVAPGSGTLTVSFEEPGTTDPDYAPVNYAVSLDNGATWRSRNPASTTSPLVIEGLTDLTTYRLRLRAINGAGAGAPSLELPVKPGIGSEAPTGLVTVSMVGASVTIAWRAPDVGLVPGQYVLEGGIAPGEVLASIPTGSVAPTFTFDAPTGAFYIRVHGTTGNLRSAASNEIRIFVNVPTAPSAPGNLLGLVNGSSLALSWTNTFSGGAPTSLWLNVTGSVTTVLPLPMADTFTYAAVPPGPYTLSVIAANASGVSPPSNVVTLSFPQPCSGVPAVPAHVQTWKVGSAVYVAWSSPASGPAVTGYVVAVSGAYVGTFTTTGRTLSGAAAPGSYRLTVAAVNPCGTGPATPPQTVVIP